MNAGIGVTQDIMLPQADDFPAKGAEFAEVALVAGAVGVKFVTPEWGEFLFPCGQPPPVPEIAIHEHGNLLFGKNNVRPAG